MTAEHETLKRWTAKRRAAPVMEILRGDTPVAEDARTHGLTVAEIEALRPVPAESRPAGPGGL